MIRHILFWKFTPEAKQEGLTEKVAVLRNRFAELPGQIDGLLSLELGEPCPPSEYDLVLYAEFTDLESVKRYQGHTLHVAIRDLAKDWVCGRACVDYESPSPDAKAL